MRQDKERRFILFVSWILVSLRGAAASHFDDEEPCNVSLVIAYSGSGFHEPFRHDLESGDLTDFTPSAAFPSPLAITADQAAGLVFYSDVIDGKIMRRDFKTPADTIVIRTLETGSQPTGLAVDPVTKRLFYTDSGKNLIASLDYNGKNRQIIITNADSPMGIAVDYNTRTIYWSNNGYIAQADYDGGNFEILEDTDILRPTGLDIHIEEQALVWCDSEMDTISIMYLDTRERETLYTRNASIFSELQFFDVMLYHDAILVSEWETTWIYLLSNGELVQFLGVYKKVNPEEFGRPNGMTQICVPEDFFDDVFDQTSPASSTTSITTKVSESTVTSAIASTKDSEPKDDSQNEIELSQTTIIIMAVAIGGGVIFTVIIAISICCCLRICKRKAQSSNQGQHELSHRPENAYVPPPFNPNAPKVSTHNSFDPPTYRPGRDNVHMIMDDGEYITPIQVQ